MKETYGFPARVFTGRRDNMKTYLFDSVTPITGDGIYRHVDDKNVVTLAVVPHPDARSNQLRYFHRIV